MEIRLGWWEMRRKGGDEVGGRGSGGGEKLLESSRW